METAIPERHTGRIHRKLSIPSERFQNALESFSETEVIPSKIANTIAAMGWMLAVEDFRNQEEDLMCSGEYKESLDEHRALLTTLISKGETISLALKESGLARTPTGFKLNDFQATLDSLYYSFDGQHGEPITEQARQLLDNLFKTA